MRLAVAMALASALAGCGGVRPPRRVEAQYLGPIASRDVAQGEHGHQIREGNALMPALPPHRLSDERVEAVLGYLSTIGAIDGGLPIDPDGPVEGESVGESESESESEGVGEGRERAERG